MDIGKIDKNFAVEAEIDKTGLCFYSADEEPFRIYGISRIGDVYYRLPPEVASTVSPGVSTLSSNTAGGRIRFVTDSGRIAIRVKLNGNTNMTHMPRTGSSGVDAYEGGKYLATYRPPAISKTGAYEAVAWKNKGEALITLNLPLYDGVAELLIGLDEGASLKPAPDYTYEKPVVFYGSSITQGGCASRPGNSYESILSRTLDANYINLGFSGNAKGEPAIAEYISSLDMSAFVYDYDHNATTVEYLLSTHEPMFRTIREKHPDLPIIIVSAPKYYLDSYRQRTREVIIKTYENALARGDKKVWFVDGSHFFDEIGDAFSVDGTHPNDLGFYYMAKGILPALREALKA